MDHCMVDILKLRNRLKWMVKGDSARGDNVRTAEKNFPTRDTTCTIVDATVNKRTRRMNQSQTHSPYVVIRLIQTISNSVVTKILILLRTTMQVNDI